MTGRVQWWPEKINEMTDFLVKSGFSKEEAVKMTRAMVEEGQMALPDNDSAN